MMILPSNSPARMDEDIDPAYHEEGTQKQRNVRARKIRRYIIWFTLFWAFLCISACLAQILVATNTHKVSERFKELGATKELLNLRRKADFNHSYLQILVCFLTSGTFCLIVANGLVGRIWNYVDSKIAPRSKDTFKAMGFMGIWRCVLVLVRRITTVNSHGWFSFEGIFIELLGTLIFGAIEGILLHRIAKNLAKHWGLLLLVVWNLSCYFGLGHLQMLALQRYPLPKTAITQPIFDLAKRENFPPDRIFVVPGLNNAGYAQIPLCELIILGGPLIIEAPNELPGIIAHELGHRKYKHPIGSHFVYGLEMVVSQAFAIYGIMGKPTIYSAFGFSKEPFIGAFSIADIFMSMFQMATKPIKLLVARIFEYQADEYAVKLGYGDQLSHGLVRLYTRLWQKSPFYEILFENHPTPAKRIENIAKLQSNHGKQPTRSTKKRKRPSKFKRLRVKK